MSQIFPNSEQTHGNLVSAFPTSAQDLRIADILRVWVEQESGGVYWGDGFPTTPYRIHEGGGDEQGSMGFNHVIWRRMYGGETDCQSNRGYLEAGDGEAVTDHNINLYHPRNSLLAFVAAAADEECGLSNGLYRAYVADEYRQATAEIPVSYCLVNGSPEGDACSDESANWQSYNPPANQDGDHVDDDYMLLGKAVIAYNMGTGERSESASLQVDSYFDFLQESPRRIGSGNNERMRPKWFGYWLTIKEKSFGQFSRDKIEGYLPYAQYLWHGGTWTEAENAEKAGEDWCFMYGEKEWRGGTSFSETRENAQQGLIDRHDCISGEVVSDV